MIGSLVLFRLINREFIQHHFAISLRPLLRSGMVTMTSEGERAKNVEPTTRARVPANDHMPTKRR